MSAASASRRKHQLERAQREFCEFAERPSAPYPFRHTDVALRGTEWGVAHPLRRLPERRPGARNAGTRPCSAVVNDQTPTGHFLGLWQIA